MIENLSLPVSHTETLQDPYFAVLHGLTLLPSVVTPRGGKKFVRALEL